jgi:hypothetical protein
MFILRFLINLVHFPTIEVLAISLRALLSNRSMRGEQINRLLLERSRNSSFSAASCRLRWMPARRLILPRSWLRRRSWSLAGAPMPWVMVARRWVYGSFTSAALVLVCRARSA